MSQPISPFSIQQILQQIRTSGAVLNPQLIRVIQQHQAEITVPLRQLLAQKTILQDDESHSFARGHALVFLSSWGDSETIAILHDVLLRHDDQLEIFYELIEYTVPAYGPEIIPVFAELINDSDAPRASRIIASSLLSMIAHLHPLTAVVVSRILCQALPPPELAASQDSELWSWIVAALAELRSKSANTQVRQLYTAGVLDPSICGRPEEFTQALNDTIYHISFRDPLYLYEQS
ncbi:MAG: hypothetical protein NT020_12235 [Chloroflexales bacterium]|nr:hypothetical protein [Chloroflexales bacterium]